jgi:hypothetical protein
MTLADNMAPPRRRGQHYTQKDLKEIQRMAEDRMTGRQIADAFGTTPDLLYGIMRYHGIKLSDQPRVPKKIAVLGKHPAGRILAMEADRRGLSSRELARRLLIVISENNMFNAILEDQDNGSDSSGSPEISV